MNKLTEDKNKKSVAFYVVSSNQELLLNINKLMTDKGLIGFKDPSGRMHYIVDGRKGAPYAAKRIDDMAKILLGKSNRNITQEELNAEFYVDAVLSCYKFDRSLRGFHFLRYMMIRLTLNPSLRQPLSKTLYPLVAQAFKVSIAQVERNLRYCLERLRQNESEQSKRENLPLVFREGVPAFKPMKFRKLIEGETRYKNTDAIRVLEAEVQKMVRMDKKKAATSDSPINQNYMSN